MVMILLALAVAYLMGGLDQYLDIKLELEGLIMFLFTAAAVEMPIDLWLMSGNEEGDYGKHKDW